MKRNIILVLCLAMGLLTISAQGKKPVAKKTTTAAAKKTNTQATIAMVDAGSGVSLEKPLAEGPDTLYFINQVSRSVLAVDKKTGNISQYIPGNREKMITAMTINMANPMMGANPASSAGFNPFDQSNSNQNA